NGAHVQPREGQSSLGTTDDDAGGCGGAYAIVGAVALVTVSDRLVRAQHEVDVPAGRRLGGAIVRHLVDKGALRPDAVEVPGGVPRVDGEIREIVVDGDLARAEAHVVVFVRFGDHLQIVHPERHVLVARLERVGEGESDRVRPVAVGRLAGREIERDLLVNHV